MKNNVEPNWVELQIYKLIDTSIGSKITYSFFSFLYKYGFMQIDDGIYILAKWILLRNIVENKQKNK